MYNTLVKFVAELLRHPVYYKQMHIIFFIALHYNIFKTSNINRGFVSITMTIYCSVVQ